MKSEQIIINKSEIQALIEACELSIGCSYVGEDPINEIETSVVVQFTTIQDAWWFGRHFEMQLAKTL